MNLERSTLERKDRSELATIAETLGRKPTSRARKSDIIDVILELTGVIPASGSSDSVDGDAAAEPAPEAAPVAAAVVESESSDDKGDDSPETSDDQAEERAAVGDEQPAAEPTRPGGAGQPNPNQRHRQNQNAQQQGGQKPGQQNSQPQNSQQSSQPQNAQGGNQQNGAEVDGDGETDGEGNRRRRRRRGRDRDRQQGDAPQGQANQGGQPQGGQGQEPSGDDSGHWEGEPIPVEGLLDLRDEGYGFLRVSGFRPGRDDVYVSVKQCRQLGLRRGDHLKGISRPPARQEKNPALLRVDEVNGKEPEESRNRRRFDELTPLFPDERLRLEQPNNPLDMTSRIIDLIAPIGKGQRGLIVSPPKAGKTTVMKAIAQAIEKGNPDVHLIVLLVDERPEEVTDMVRSIQGEVVASTFDRPTEEHIAIAELTIERAKRLVEYGQDVVIILDGITRLSRAYNLAAPTSGRVMSGGIDTGALYPPKKFFGAARNVEEGGSLTILATALVETGSKMDEVIFEEFKGTGNMELRLDRRMAERRIYPAIDVDASSTRHEELLFDRKQLQQVWRLRRLLSGMAAEGKSGAGLELLIDRLKAFRTNDEFLAEIAKQPNA